MRNVVGRCSICWSLVLCLGLFASVSVFGSDSSTGESSPEANIAISSSHIKISGTRLHFLEGGDPRALTVLFLHGGRFTSRTWQELGTLDLLVRQGYRILALDLPGFGDSDSKTDLQPSEILASFATLVAQQPVVVVSPSMSGRFSLPFLVQRSSQLAGFVAIAPVEISSYIEMLEGSKVPSLIVWGENDKVIPLRESKALLEALPNGRRVILKDAAHACYLDQPIEFHRELLQFLATLVH